MDSGRVAGWFVPSRCPLCRAAIDPGSLLCGACVRSLNQCEVVRGDPPEGVDRISSCADHDGTARELLTAFKFRHLTGLAGLIAGFMADAADLSGQKPILVGVPPARFRTWLRGFDPVALLVEGIAAELDLAPSLEAVLDRKGARRQRGRGRAGRIGDPPDIRPRENAGHRIGGREILLVDDVMTTGATLSAAAAALRREGAAAIRALTFTRRL